MKNYKLSYLLEFDNNKDMGFSKKEALYKNHKNPKCGFCDASVFISIIRPEDGSLSTLILSNDGDNEGKPLSAKELFKVMFSLACHIEKMNSLKNWQDYCLKFFINIVRKCTQEIVKNG